ncbi:MAG: hypothetical protein RLO01_19325 [Thalassobaculaceae bacterium]
MAHPAHLRMQKPSSPRIPVCRLTTGEALIVWAIRHWVQSVRARLDPRDLLARGFATLEAGDGAAQELTQSVDRLLMLTLEQAVSVRDVGCVRCPTLGDGERDVLTAIALAQRGRRERALEQVRTWLPEVATRIAYGEIALLGRVLQTAGLTLPLRSDGLEDIWWMDSLAGHQGPSALFH